jgi:hypothetical protein
MAVSALPFKILQMPGVTVPLFEEFHRCRQIHTDGRQLPVDPNPAWYGYSIGRWEGDTFAVETSGFKEGSWLDSSVIRIPTRCARPNASAASISATWRST